MAKRAVEKRYTPRIQLQAELGILPLTLTAMPSQWEPTNYEIYNP
jgi:hypothetical protein